MTYWLSDAQIKRVLIKDKLWAKRSAELWEKEQIGKQKYISLREKLASLKKDALEGNNG
jgi:hypothetical protein